MPVIGRLDGQVEEVLINPVGGRSRAGEENRADPARPPGGRASDETAEDDGVRATREDEGRSREAGALPVWLL